MAPKTLVPKRSASSSQRKVSSVAASSGYGPSSIKPVTSPAQLRAPPRASSSRLSPPSSPTRTSSPSPPPPPPLPRHYLQTTAAVSARTAPKVSQPATAVVNGQTSNASREAKAHGPKEHLHRPSAQAWLGHAGVEGASPGATEASDADASESPDVVMKLPRKSFMEPDSDDEPAAPKIRVHPPGKLRGSIMSVLSSDSEGPRQPPSEGCDAHLPSLNGVGSAAVLSDYVGEDAAAIEDTFLRNASAASTRSRHHQLIEHFHRVSTPSSSAEHSRRHQEGQLSTLHSGDLHDGSGSRAHRDVLDSSYSRSYHGAASGTHLNGNRTHMHDLESSFARSYQGAGRGGHHTDPKIAAREYSRLQALHEQRGQHGGRVREITREIEAGLPNGALSTAATSSQGLELEELRAELEAVRQVCSDLALDRDVARSEARLEVANANEAVSELNEHKALQQRLLWSKSSAWDAQSIHGWPQFGYSRSARECRHLELDVHSSSPTRAVASRSAPSSCSGNTPQSRANGHEASNHASFSAAQAWRRAARDRTPPPAAHDFDWYNVPQDPGSDWNNHRRSPLTEENSRVVDSVLDSFALDSPLHNAASSIGHLQSKHCHNRALVGTVTHRTPSERSRLRANEPQCQTSRSNPPQRWG